VTTTLTYEAQQGLTAAVVFAVRLQVIGELLDTVGKQRDLALGGTSVGGGAAVLGENLGLFSLER
jgi:hypothetical protein